MFELALHVFYCHYVLIIGIQKSDKSAAVGFLQNFTDFLLTCDRSNFGCNL